MKATRSISRVGGGESTDDGSQHRRQVVFDLLGTEAKEAQAQTLQEALTMQVGFALRLMNGTIHLYYESLAGAEEIHHKGTDWLLSPEPAAT